MALVTVKLTLEQASVSKYVLKQEQARLAAIVATPASRSTYIGVFTDKSVGRVELRDIERRESLLRNALLEWQ